MTNKLRILSTTNTGYRRMGLKNSASTLRAYIGIIAFAICLQLVSTPAKAADQNELTNVSITSLPGDRAQITLKMAKPATAPVSFTIDNPARIAMDLANTSNKLAKRNQTIGIGIARSMNTVEAKGRTRVVLNLTEMVAYETRVDGNDIIVTLNSGLNATASKGGTASGINNVDFRRGEKGEGRIIISLANPSTSIDMRQEGNKIIVDFLNSKLPQNLERRLDVLDFATPVKTIDTFSQGNNTRMEVSLVGDFDHLAYQSDNIYTVEVKPLTKQQKAAEQKKKFGYTGERLSLNFQSIEVRAVLQLLADFTGLNVVVSDTVTGNLTLRLKNVPWDQALDIILKTRGLAMRQTGNVVLIAPSEEIAAREKLELESQKQIEELAPLKTEWFQINYATGADIAALLKSEANSLLSERGSITVDERTNTLLIQDTADKLTDIRKVITRLDIPVRQVMIESRIVVATDNFSKDLGVKFGAAGQRSNGSADYTVGGDGIAGTAPSTGIGDLIVNLPAAAAAPRFGIALARVGRDVLQLELSALQVENRGEVLSNPRVITANQQEAIIKSGVEIPYQEASSSGATSVSFKDAVLELKVTPQITPDDRISMKLSVSNDSIGDTFNGVPSINTNEIKTEVLVDNGETIVLGGVYKQTDTHSSSRIPFFGDLPLLGYLFRDKHNRDNKEELLIFVTPKIVKDTGQ